MKYIKKNLKKKILIEKKVHIIPLTWYIESPIDFEHKQYVLLGYLQKVDSSFMNKILSPHLLHMEKMILELYHFNQSYKSIKKDFDKNRYIYIENNHLIGEDNILVDEVYEIVNFSIPQIKTRLDLGNLILKKSKQILF